MPKYTKTDARGEETIFMLSFIVMMLAFHFEWTFVGWCFLVKAIAHLIITWYVVIKRVKEKENEA